MDNIIRTEVFHSSSSLGVLWEGRASDWYRNCDTMAGHSHIRASREHPTMARQTEFLRWAFVSLLSLAVVELVGARCWPLWLTSSVKRLRKARACT
eukprot:jgi/Botrbrau1/3547/Bobra.0078s0004.1